MHIAVHRAESLGGSGDAFVVDVPEADGGARGDQALGDGIADSCCTAGDNSLAAVEIDPIHGNFLLSLVIIVMLHELAAPPSARYAAVAGSEANARRVAEAVDGGVIA